MGPVSPGWCGAGKGCRRQYDSHDEHDRARGPSLRHRLHRRRLPQETSRIRLAEARAHRHEERRLDHLQRGGKTVGEVSDVSEVSEVASFTLLGATIAQMRLPA